MTPRQLKEMAGAEEDEGENNGEAESETNEEEDAGMMGAMDVDAVCDSPSIGYVLRSCHCAVEALGGEMMYVPATEKKQAVGGSHENCFSLTFELPVGQAE